MNTSKIEWTDKTWNPVTGCTKVSQGCKHCYAETFYERFHGKGSFRNVTCHEERLRIPFSWTKPSMVFVNSMSDLFHEDVPFAFIKTVLHTIYHAPKHTFQVLTKRAQRMVEFFEWLDNSDLADNFRNLWLGVSVEDQKAADERIPLLLQVPAAVRFLSCEPLLGPVNLRSVPIVSGAVYRDVLKGSQQNGPADDFVHLTGLPKIDWVIAGGESGNKARPMHTDWARSLRDQCAATGVPFFFKQWGGRNKKKAGRELDGQLHNAFPETVNL